MNEERTLWDKDESIEEALGGDPIHPIETSTTEERAGPALELIKVATRRARQFVIGPNGRPRVEEREIAIVYYHDESGDGNTQCDDWECEACHGDECDCNVCEEHGVNGHA